MKMVLDTERLLIRRFREDDAEAILIMEREPEVLRHVGRKPLASVDDYRKKIQATFLPYDDKPGGFGVWAVVEKVSGEFIGACSLRPAPDSTIAREMAYGPDEVELGYGLRRPSWGRGYASEMAHALVGKAFVAMRVDLLVASVTVANVASIRVLEKAGLRRTGLPRYLPDEDEPSVKFVLTRNRFHLQYGAAAAALPCTEGSLSPV